MAVN
jgi:hypothetical protein